MSVAEVENETPETEQPETPDEETPEQPEQPETPETPEQPEQPETPETPQVTPEQMEKFYKGLATRTATLDRWIEAELGDNYADLSACPLCSDGIVGHIYPPEWMEATTELQGRLLDVLRTPSAPEYQPAPNVRRCGTCDGWGRVDSGSRVAGKGNVVCPTCKGYGFQGEGLTLTEAAPDNAHVEFEGPVDGTPLNNAATDDWGTPRLLADGQENPNWGRQPQYWDRSLPHGGAG